MTSPDRHDAPLLRDVPLTGPRSRPNVCIVTSEIIGPFRNGGIGTAMTGLAELLAGAGLPVTVLYTGGIWSPDLDLGGWRRRYAERGITFDALAFDDMKSLAGPVRDRGFSIPWLVHEYLAARSFDVIHFNDCCGDGSIALAAKKLGLAYGDSLLAVALHSPSRWVLELNQILPENLVLSAFDFAEQLTLRAADLLWSPSRYLLDWVASRGFTLPPRTYIQQYALPSSPAAAAPYRRSATPRELVFFGRLEERKGLRLFCNAIHLLRDELAQRGIAVTFLGKPERCAGMPSLDYVRRRAATWRFEVKTITDLGQPEALRYLLEGGRLAVMPSPFDNSPCTVYEALAGGIPFLAARTGGIPELVHPDDQEHVLFDYATAALRDALHDAIDRGGWIARPAVTQDETRKSWIAVHEQWRTFLPPREEGDARPLSAAVLIDHAGDPQRFAATLDSLRACPSVRRFIVLNRTGDELPLPSLDLLAADPELLDGELAAIAEDAVLLLHSGVTVDAGAFERMLRALRDSPLDGLQPAARDDAHRTLPPLGGSAAFSLFEGVTYTGGLLLRRECLLESRRPFAVESPFMGLADFCVAGGRSIWPYPAPVLTRAAGVRIDPKSALPARVAAYGSASPNERFYMLAAGYGAATHPYPRGVKQQFAMALLDRGLGRLVRAGSWGLRQLRRLRR